jgi:hypothetical protein
LLVVAVVAAKVTAWLGVAVAVRLHLLVLLVALPLRPSKASREQRTLLFCRLVVAAEQVLLEVPRTVERESRLALLVRLSHAVAVVVAVPLGLAVRAGVAMHKPTVVRLALLER